MHWLVIIGVYALVGDYWCALMIIDVYALVGDD